MKKLSFIMALLVGSITMANAQSIQTLVLNNGSEMEGYIATQRPGVDFTFASNRATIFLAPEDVKSITDREILITDLDDVWKKWADENDAYVGIGNNRVFRISDIEKKDGSTIKGVKVLERGSRIKYVEITDNSYSLKWSDIILVKNAKRSRTQLSGIDRVYKLSDNRTFMGQYVEEIPGKTVCLYNDNGFIEVINLDKVVQDSRVAINNDQTIFDQSEYLDVVVKKDGSIYKGVIIERNYLKNSATSYLLIQMNNNSINSILFNDIAQYRREPNDEFKPLYDVLLRENEYVLNRSEIKAITPEIIDEMVIVDETKCENTIAYAAPYVDITVESCFANNNDYLNIKLVKVKKYRDSINKNSEIFNGFSYSDITRYGINYTDIKISRNNTTKMSYQIKEPGLYALYNIATKQAYIFKVE